MITRRMATAEDIVQFYGRPWPKTLRAVVLLLDEKPVGVIGLSRENFHHKLFSDAAPELEPHLKSMAVMRGLKQVMQWVEESPLPVLAVADNPPLLEKLGFEHLDGDVYQWQN